MSIHVDLSVQNDLDCASRRGSYLRHVHRMSNQGVDPTSRSAQTKTRASDMRPLALSPQESMTVVSHDLKNMLGAIRMNTSHIRVSLKQGRGEPEIRRLAARIEK